MSHRPVLSAVLVAATLAGTSLASPAPAIGAANVSERAGLNCPVGVRGFTSDGRLVSRSLDNDTVTSDKISANALSFRPRAISGVGGREIEGGFEESFTSISADGRTRVITLTQLAAEETTTVSVTPMRNRNFYQRLLVSASGYYEYMVSGRGVLNRWTTAQDARGRIFFTNPVLVRKGLGNLKTLTYSWTMRIDGRKTDVLWGTTKQGALVQLQIPVRNLGKSELRTVKRSGFKDVTGLSASFCNQNPAHLTFLAIEAGNNRARWFTLRNQVSPKAANLVNHGVVAAGVNWRIRAVI
jgi:hypothetical protein